MKRPTDGASPNSRLLTTKSQASRRDHRADLVAEDRAESDAEGAQQRDSGKPAEHHQSEVAAAERDGIPRAERISEPMPTASPTLTAPNTSPASSPAVSLADSTFGAARREQERRADRPVAVLAGDQQHSGEAREDQRDGAGREQAALIMP